MLDIVDDVGDTANDKIVVCMEACLGALGCSL